MSWRQGDVSNLMRGSRRLGSLNRSSPAPWLIRGRVPGRAPLETTKKVGAGGGRLDSQKKGGGAVGEGSRDSEDEGLGEIVNDLKLVTERLCW